MHFHSLTVCARVSVCVRWCVGVQVYKCGYWIGLVFGIEIGFGKERRAAQRNALCPRIAPSAPLLSSAFHCRAIRLDFPGPDFPLPRSFRFVCTHDCCDFPLFVIFRLLVAIRSFLVDCIRIGVPVAAFAQITATPRKSHE